MASEEITEFGNILEEISNVEANLDKLAGRLDQQIDSMLTQLLDLSVYYYPLIQLSVDQAKDGNKELVTIFQLIDEKLQELQLNFNTQDINIDE